MIETLPRIAAPLTSQAFHDAYWTPRQPVVIRGAADALLGSHQGWAAEVLFARMRARRQDVVQNLLWYDTAEGVLADRHDLPAFIADHVYGDGHLTRRLHYRLFLHPRGHTTGLHYEGNLFDVFSYQLRGHKRWKLLRGDRAHKLLPFYFLENQSSYAPTGDPPDWTCDVDLAPGDLLFLPRGWYHHVECPSDDNVGLSLVSAPRDTAALDCLTLRTYREQLALQYHLRGVLPRRFADKVETFLTSDADGLRWARHYIAGVSPAAMLRRLATDLGLVTPRMLATFLLDGRSLQYLADLKALGVTLQRNLER